MILVSLEIEHSLFFTPANQLYGIGVQPEGELYRSKPRKDGKAKISFRSSMDSGLEAFSLNPTGDNFAALAVQPTALSETRCNGSSRTELHYCWNDMFLIFISRVKLTCLTTV